MSAFCKVRASDAMTKRSKPLSQPNVLTTSLPSHESTRQPDRVASEQGDRAKDERPPFAGMPFLWPLHVASTMGASAGVALNWYAGMLAGVVDAEAEAPEFDWTTSNRTVLDLPTMRLRDFSTGGGQPALICAPYALHGATIADFAPHHSVVEALQRSGMARLAVTEWRSAEDAMQYFSIDTYLADLNIAVDEMGAPVDLVGLCQGGWMALVYAARFPEKVRRLVLVGAPVDVRAAPSPLMRNVDDLPLGAFENLVRLGAGRVLGHYALKLWGSSSTVDDAARILQCAAGAQKSDVDALKHRFATWHSRTVDLPGAYYMQVVQEVFKENRIAEGRFIALGRVIDLRSVRAPMYLLAGADDEIVPSGQLFAATRLVSTPRGCVEIEEAPCGHLGLFMGADTIADAWPRIGRWLSRDFGMALAS
jgi:poly-beta-hydroxyalkanoate depolymerase